MRKFIFTENFTEVKEVKEKEKKQNYYHCYSPTQKRFLIEMGFRMREERVNKANGKTFWIFKMNNSLSIALKAWTTMKNLPKK